MALAANEAAADAAAAAALAAAREAAREAAAAGEPPEPEEEGDARAAAAAEAALQALGEAVARRRFPLAPRKPAAVSGQSSEARGIMLAQATAALLEALPKSLGVTNPNPSPNPNPNPSPNPTPTPTPTPNQAGGPFEFVEPHARLTPRTTAGGGGEVVVRVEALERGNRPGQRATHRSLEPSVALSAGGVTLAPPLAPPLTLSRSTRRP